MNYQKGNKVKIHLIKIAGNFVGWDNRVAQVLTGQTGVIEVVDTDYGYSHETKYLVKLDSPRPIPTSIRRFRRSGFQQTS